MAKKIDIAGQLNSTAADNKLADASQIYDSKKGKFQEKFNEDIENKVESYKQELEQDVNNAVANLVGGASETFDTLKEFEDWVNNDKSGAAAIAKQANENKTAVADLNASTGISEYPAFDPAKDYAAGDVVKYEGRLYKFVTEHVAGEWNGTDVENWSERKDNLYNNKTAVWNDNSGRFVIDTSAMTFSIIEGIEDNLIIGGIRPVVLLSNFSVSCPLFSGTDPSGLSAIIYNVGTKELKSKVALYAGNVILGAGEVLLAVVSGSYGITNRQFRELRWAGGPIVIDGLKNRSFSELNKKIDKGIGDLGALAFDTAKNSVRRILWGEGEKRFKINTADLTFNIVKGAEITLKTGNTNGIVIRENYSSSCPIYIEDDATSFCCIVIDISNNAIYPKKAALGLDVNENVLAIIRTSYGIDNKSFIRVEWAGGPIYIDDILRNSWSEYEEKVTTIESSVNSIEKKVPLYDKVVDNKYTAVIELPKGEHSSLKDQVAVNFKAGDIIRVELDLLGATLPDSAIPLLYGYANDGTTALWNTPINNSRYHTVPKDTTNIGLYIYTQTAGKVGIVAKIDNDRAKIEREISQNMKYSQRRAYWDNSCKRFNIDTSNLTLKISTGAEFVVILGAKTRPVVIEASQEISCLLYDETDITSYCGIVMDVINETIKAKPMVSNTAIKDDEVLLMVVRTSYGDASTKKFTAVEWAGGPIYIDGVLYNNWKDTTDRIALLEDEVKKIPEVVIPTGEYIGESINLKRNFKETFIRTITSSQALLPDKTLYSVGNQGAAIYEDKYAVFATLSTLRTDESQQKFNLTIVDIEEHTVLGEFWVGTDGTMAHGNNLNLGNKYSDDDVLPLVYVSDFYTPYRCNVLRISNDFQSYTKVQKITYIGTKLFERNPRGIDYAIDIDGGYIYVLASHYPNYKNVTFAKYVLPDILDGDVELSDEEAIEVFTIENLNIQQGALVVDNRMYIGLGYNTGDEWIKVINLDTKQIVSIIPLSYEPEGMTVYKGKIAVSNGGWSFNTYEDVR